MGFLQTITAIAFYLPFLLTITFALIALFLGIAVLFSGTILILLFAAYGLYTVCRDLGYIQRFISFFKRAWTYLSKDVIHHVEQSFPIEGYEHLPPGPALFICHPHGLFGQSWIFHFCYQLHPWPSDKQRPLLAIHSILFQIPFIRDVLEQFHCIEAKETIIKQHLEKGHSVAILTGGIEELQHNGSKQVKLVLEKRKGYARIAKECKVPIVPMFSQGENELFPNETFWLWTTVNNLCHKWLGVPLILPSWKSMKQWATIVRRPLETPVKTFILPAISTQEKDEKTIRKECIRALKSFFKDKQIPVEFIG